MDDSDQNQEQGGHVHDHDGGRRMRRRTNQRVSRTPGTQGDGERPGQANPQEQKTVISTLLVPYTLGSSLQKKVQKAEDEFCRITGGDRVRVIEKGGDVLINLIRRNDPWAARRSCTDVNCPTCQSRRRLSELAKNAKKEGVKLPEGMIVKTSTQCRREGSNYAAQCEECLKVGLMTTYRGESSRSSRQRHKEHLSDLDHGVAASPLVAHAVEVHGGRTPSFLFTIGTIEPRPPHRAVRESVEIAALPNGIENMNRCQEWGVPRVPILTVSGGDPPQPLNAADGLNERPDWSKETMEGIREGRVKRVRLIPMTDNPDSGAEERDGEDAGEPQRKVKRARRRSPTPPANAAGAVLPAEPVTAPATTLVVMGGVAGTVASPDPTAGAGATYGQNESRTGAIGTAGREGEEEIDVVRLLQEKHNPTTATGAGSGVPTGPATSPATTMVVMGDVAISGDTPNPAPGAVEDAVQPPSIAATAVTAAAATVDVELLLLDGPKLGTKPQQQHQHQGQKQSNSNSKNNSNKKQSKITFFASTDARERWRMQQPMKSPTPRPARKPVPRPMSPLVRWLNDPGGRTCQPPDLKPLRAARPPPPVNFRHPCQQETQPEGMRLREEQDHEQVPRDRIDGQELGAMPCPGVVEMLAMESILKATDGDQRRNREQPGPKSPGGS